MQFPLRGKGASMNWKVFASFNTLSHIKSKFSSDVSFPWDTVVEGFWRVLE